MDKLRELLHSLLLWGGLLFGGVFAGMGLAEWLAPGSDWAQFVGFMTLPLIFGAGMSAWRAFAGSLIFSRLIRALFKMARGQDFEQAAKESFRDLEGKPIPGTHVFVPISLMISLIAGLLIALSPETVGFFQVVGVMVAAGLGYGLLLRWLARTGRLPMPD